MPIDDDEFTTKFNELFHKASAERERRFMNTLDKHLDTKFESTFNTKFDELKRIIMEDDGEAPPAPAPGQQSPTGGTAGMSPELQAQMKRIADDAKSAKETADKYKREAEAEKAQRARMEERQLIQGAIGPYVKPTLLDMVVSRIHEKHLIRDQEDPQKILWKNEDGEVLPFKDGAEFWRKSDFGKEVAPPKDARGSGSRSPDGADANKGPVGLEDLGNALMGVR
jgi:hypothetical protein